MCRGAAAAKGYRDDVRQRMARHGRNPDHCKVMFSVGIVLGETREEALAKKARADAALSRNMETRLARLSFLSGVDFSRFPLDEPLPEVKTNASRGQTALMTSGTGRTTLREMLTDPRPAASTSSARPTASPQRWRKRPRRWAATAS